MKKIVSLVLCALVLCTLSVTAFAESTTSSKTAPYIEARYSDFSNIYAALYKNDFGFYNIGGGAGTFSNSKWIEVTVTLEGCGTDGEYYPIEGFEWTDADYSVAGISATRDLAGGSYRTHTNAKCYLNGTLLEEEDVYSNIVYVPY